MKIKYCILLSTSLVFSPGLAGDATYTQEELF